MISKLLRSIIPEQIRPVGYLTSLTRKRTESMVRTGPFAGMKYVKVSQGSAYIPKLLGIYERELTPDIESLIASSPRLIIDIGAAEGFYAVGLARRIPNTRVIAFEMESRGREALHQMATFNDVVDRIEICGKCESTDLLTVLGDGTSAAIICDVEGYEHELLDPTKIPSLKNALMIIEMHDFVVPNITETIKRRFSATHEIKEIHQESRDVSDYPWRTIGTSFLPRAYLHWAVSEWRPVNMNWLVLRPINSER